LKLFRFSQVGALVLAKMTFFFLFSFRIVLVFGQRVLQQVIISWDLEEAGVLHILYCQCYVLRMVMPPFQSSPVEFVKMELYPSEYHIWKITFLISLRIGI